MKTNVAIGLAAATFMAGSLMSAGGSQVNPNVPGGPVPRLAGCHPGFTFSSAGSHEYDCKTGVIACPAETGFKVSVSALPVVKSPQGMRLSYRCLYQPRSY